MMSGGIDEFCWCDGGCAKLADNNSRTQIGEFGRNMAWQSSCESSGKKGDHGIACA
jgi:hypothetical protein